MRVFVFKDTIKTLLEQGEFITSIEGSKKELDEVYEEAEASVQVQEILLNPHTTRLEKYYKIVSLYNNMYRDQNKRSEENEV